MKNFSTVILADSFEGQQSNMDSLPQFLHEIDGRKLIEWQLEALKQIGIKKINIVVGYQREAVFQILEKYSKLFDLTILYNNEFYNRGNSFSLYLGTKNIRENTLVIDGNYLLGPKVLNNFLEELDKDCILVRKGDLKEAESTKVLVDNTNFVSEMISKRLLSLFELKNLQFVGVFSGGLKISLSTMQEFKNFSEQYVKEEKNIKKNLEDLLSDFCLNHKFTYQMAQCEIFKLANQEKIF